MGSESIHKKLERVRKPRVHITYDVETEGAVIQKELPFVMGVMGDFTGNAPRDKKSLKERKFIQIDRDNIDEVMDRMEPGLQLKVDNKLKDDGSQIAVDLKFNSLDDFEPAQVVDQVEPLRKLLETRNKLRDLLTKADRSEELESLLEKVLQNTDEIENLSRTLNSEESEKGGRDEQE